MKVCVGGGGGGRGGEGVPFCQFQTAVWQIRIISFVKLLIGRWTWVNCTISLFIEQTPKIKVLLRSLWGWMFPVWILKSSERVTKYEWLNSKWKIISWEGENEFGRRQLQWYQIQWISDKFDFVPYSRRIPTN